MSKQTAQISYRYNTPRLLIDRQYGMKHKIGYNDDIAVKIYKNLDAYVCDIPSCSDGKIPHCGGIFNLEFSLDG